MADMFMNPGSLSSFDATRNKKSVELFHITGGASANLDSDGLPTCPLRHLPKRPPVDIQFTNLSYSVQDNKCDGYKTILHDLQGDFKSGQLVAILGPSGAGKSTLMNVLVGYRRRGMSGTILVNKEEQDLQTFRKICCYIMQLGVLLPYLTVIEAMTVSANLKLGKSVSDREKKVVIDEIIDTMGLKDCVQTRCSNLSGGQKKRVSIAMELVNNPPVMFLDEPTSGLDSSSCLQCITLLKSLARGGRTIICTIHQPSARLFEMFDQLYTLSNGHCIYQGPVHCLVPFLGNLGLQCPSYHNPADFVIEVANGQFGNVQPTLTAEVNKNLVLRTMSDCADGGLMEKSPNGYCKTGDSSKTRELPLALTTTSTVNMLQSSDLTQGSDDDDTPSTSYQFYILLKRTLLSTYRDQTLTQLRMVSHFVVGLIIGFLYLKKGEDASNVTNNSGCIFFTVLFLMFSSMMPTILTFPMEMSVFTREHLNHWYSLKSFYLAKTSADIPFQIVFTVVYICIIYYLTEQPREYSRFLMFLLICILLALVAQSKGLLVGAALSVETGTYFGPVCAIPCILFSGFFVTLDAIPSCMQWVPYFSYLRYGFEGCMLSIYGFNRGRLKCTEAYCHYRSPTKFLEQLSMLNSSYWMDVVVLIIFFIALRTATYFVLKWKIKSF